MGKLPYFNLYPNDWSRDMEEHPLDIEGAWIRICCKLWWSRTRGKLTKTMDQWAKILGQNEQETERIFKYIHDEKIGKIDKKNGNNGNITIVSRRMVRDEKDRRNNTLRQRRHREKQPNNNNVTHNNDVTPPVTPMSQLSSSSSSSSSSNKNKSRDLSSIDIKLTQYLIDGILGNNPEASVIKHLTPKRKDEWINQCRLLRMADGRTPEQILAVIQFSQADDFWKGNILSMSKLREKWDQLFLKAQAAGKGSGYKRSEGARYVPLTPAEQIEEDKLLAEYYAAQKKFMEAKGYKSDEEIPFEEIVTFADFKSGVKWERR